MATYSKSLGYTVGGNSDYTYVLEAITIPASEQFYRCKIQISGTTTGNAQLRGNAQSVLGSRGFDTWTTNATAISWTNGATPKVKIHNGGSSGQSWRVTVIIETTAIPDFTITCSSGTGGTLTANKSKAAAGATVTLTPKASKGYQLSSLTASPTVTISSAYKFTMPAANITITATWTKINYALSINTNPVGAGTVDTTRQGSHVSTATYNQPVRAEQTPAAGYFFNGWTTNPAGVEIAANGVFYMPASALTITANYLKRSTATINKATLIGGDTAALTITAENPAYTHKYQLSFGTGMETQLTDVAAGVTVVEISIPLTWAEEIPNDIYQTGGTLLVETYSGETKIGEYEITGLQYMVPVSAVPEVSDITASIVRTIGGTTYANVGDYYIQSHSAVEIEADAEGILGSTIESMAVVMSGYTGSSYSELVLDDEIDFTSGLLTNAGDTQISVTATDSRGRTATVAAVIHVEAYTAPEGALDVWRVDVNGDEDDMGGYGKYSLTKRITSIGSNHLTAFTLNCQGSTVTPGADTGDLLPGTGNRQSYSLQQEYTVTLTLTDDFETTVITTRLPSAKFIIYVAADGDRMAFFKANSQQVPSGKSSVLEISSDTQIYIGTETLEEFIQRIAGS